MDIYNTGALSGERYRVIVSTDIGGSDPDDFQSMVHYLLYSDLFDTEGLISSAWGDGRANDILDVIDQYEADYENLSSYSKDYPTPEYLRSITKQGAIDIAPLKGYRESTEGSELIIQCAKKDDPRPLYILGWGLLEDIAQALHDDPSIIDKLRVYFIGGPNKKWGLDAYEYIRKNFSNLWIIENNSTYRGWFVGGNQDEDWGNLSFVTKHIKGHGALGDYFAQKLGGVIKMGDTPTVAYLLNGTPEIPENPGWGGNFVKVFNRPTTIVKTNTTLENKIEVFEVLELVFTGPECRISENEPAFKLVVKNQEFNGYYHGNGEYIVRFMPKELGRWSYQTVSDIPELNGLKGEFISVEETEQGRIGNAASYPSWWSDVLTFEDSEGVHKGAKTINKWREEYLKNFRERFDRCLKKKEL